MSTNIRRIDEAQKHLASAFFDLAERLGHKDLADELASQLGRIEVAPTGVDGRSVAWTDERKAEFGARIRESWAKKRDAKGADAVHNDTYHAYRYSDAAPEVIKGRQALADASGLALGTIHNKLSKSPDGFVNKHGRVTTVYARDEDARDRLCQSVYLLTGDSDDMVILPAKKSKRF